jgi:hypothetical protein
MSEFEPRTVQPVASHYTDGLIPTPYLSRKYQSLLVLWVPVDSFPGGEVAGPRLKRPQLNCAILVWRHTWRKNWVKCAVLTGNSEGLRTVLSSRLSHREMRSSLRESHSFISLPADTTTASSQGTQQNWQKNTDKPDGKPVLWERTFSSVFRAVFLHS